MSTCSGTTRSGDACQNRVVETGGNCGRCRGSVGASSSDARADEVAPNYPAVTRDGDRYALDLPNGVTINDITAGNDALDEPMVALTYSADGQETVEVLFITFDPDPAERYPLRSDDVESYELNWSDDDRRAALDALLSCRVCDGHFDNHNPEMCLTQEWWPNNKLVTGSLFIHGADVVKVDFDDTLESGWERKVLDADGELTLKGWSGEPSQLERAKEIWGDQMLCNQGGMYAVRTNIYNVADGSLRAETGSYGLCGYAAAESEMTTEYDETKRAWEWI